MLKFKEGGLKKGVLLEVDESKDKTDIFGQEKNLVKAIAEYIKQGAGGSE